MSSISVQGYTVVCVACARRGLVLCSSIHAMCPLLHRGGYKSDTQITPTCTRKAYACIVDSNALVHVQFGPVVGPLCEFQWLLGYMWAVLILGVGLSLVVCPPCPCNFVVW